MSTINHLLSAKGFQVHSIAPSATVLDAVHQMNDRTIGCLVVIAVGQVVGVFTERDVLRRVLARGLSPAQTTVGDVMTSEIVVCRPEMTVDEASAIMRDRRVRHLPVVADQGDLMGVISIGDVNAFRAKDQESTILFLHEYVYGRA